ncbi:MAG TPA: DUF448 domain-containing protein [Candidatus Nanoarchaeia archaeon]|nr:DUF448 domain-containing protein [Candidatus Nanoarchaeia archaeon]
MIPKPINFPLASSRLRPKRLLSLRPKPSKRTNKLTIPVRSCRICRKRADKDKLQRWVSSETGLVADPKQIMLGRGYYACSPEHAELLPKTIKRGHK